MTIPELKAKYSEKEISLFPGDPKLRYKAFAPLFQNLYENKVVYHERFTGIIRLEDVIITLERFEAKAIPLLCLEKNYVHNGIKIGFDEFFFKRESWKFGAKWEILCLTGNKLGAPYANWLMWPTPELVQKVEKLILEKKHEEAYGMLDYWS